VKLVNGWKKQHRGRKKAAGRRAEPKELTRGICGSRMKLAATCRKVYCRAAVARCMRDIFRPNTTRHAKVAQRKENSIGKDHTRDKVMLGTSKGWMLERENRHNHNLIRGTRIEPNRKMTGLEIAK
jgi:hypothetical protein